MKKVKEILIELNNWKLIILIVFIIAGAFYWFEVRPSNIKKHCFIESKEKAIEKRNFNGKFYKDDYDAYYKWCLQSKGL